MCGIPRGDNRLDRQRDFPHTPSRVGLDYTLSVSCGHAHFHLVSAPSPCDSICKESERFRIPLQKVCPTRQGRLGNPLGNRVGAWLRIISVTIIVSLPTSFPSGHPTLSPWSLEDRCSPSRQEMFPEFENVALLTRTSTSFRIALFSAKWLPNRNPPSRARPSAGCLVSITSGPDARLCILSAEQ